MIDLTNYAVYALLAVGVILVATSAFSHKWVLSKIFSKKVPTTTNKEEGFLTVVSLWYQLKKECDACGLKEASNKLDEVFPLLNKVILNDQAT